MFSLVFLFKELETFLLALYDSKLFSKVDSILSSTFIVYMLFAFECSNVHSSEIFSQAKINPIEQKNIKKIEKIIKFFLKFLTIILSSPFQ